MEFTLVWAALTGVGGLWLGIRLTPRARTVIDDPFGTLLGAGVVGLFAGRLGAMILSGTNPVTHPADILLVRGGVHTGVASVGALVALGWMGRAKPAETFDAAGAPALAGLAGWHLGCIWRSGCLGTATDLPWALTSPGSDVGRHPTELYTAILFIGASWLIWRWWSRRSALSGMVGATAVAGAGLIRLVTEPFRLSLGSGATIWYVTGVLAGSLLVAWLVAGHRRRPHRRESTDTTTLE